MNREELIKEVESKIPLLIEATLFNNKATAVILIDLIQSNTESTGESKRIEEALKEIETLISSLESHNEYACFADTSLILKVYIARALDIKSTLKGGE